MARSADGVGQPHSRSPGPPEPHTSLGKHRTAAQPDTRRGCHRLILLWPLLCLVPGSARGHPEPPRNLNSPGPATGHAAGSGRFACPACVDRVRGAGPGAGPGQARWSLRLPAGGGSTGPSPPLSWGDPAPSWLCCGLSLPSSSPGGLEQGPSPAETGRGRGLPMAGFKPLLPAGRCVPWAPSAPEEDGLCDWQHPRVGVPLCGRGVCHHSIQNGLSGVRKHRPTFLWVCWCFENPLQTALAMSTRLPAGLVISDSFQETGPRCVVLGQEAQGPRPRPQPPSQALLLPGQCPFPSFTLAFREGALGSSRCPGLGRKVSVCARVGEGPKPG